MRDNEEYDYWTIYSRVRDCDFAFFAVEFPIELQYIVTLIDINLVATTAILAA